MITIPNETAINSGGSVAVRLPVEWCRGNNLVKGSPIYVVGDPDGAIWISATPMEWSTERRLNVKWKRPMVNLPAGIARSRGITVGTALSIEMVGATLALRRVS